MSEEIKGFSEHFAGFTRHLKLAAATSMVIVLGGVGFAYSLPDVYKSQGYVLIEAAAVPEAIVRSTVTTYATRQLTNLNEKIVHEAGSKTPTDLSQEDLEHLIRSAGYEPCLVDSSYQFIIILL